MFPSVTFELPPWVNEIIGDRNRLYPRLEDRMALVIQLAERNIHEGGGPFGAGVFETHSGKLIAPGVNMVLQKKCSLAHAESIAIMIAQQACHTYDLSSEGAPAMELVSSAQPCIQCFGNLWWSGIKRLVVGANKQDVEELTGFQEGPVPHNWIAQLEQRSPLPPISVVKDVMRNEAREVLEQYITMGGQVYNPSFDE